MLKTTNPAARAGANRVLNVKAFSTSNDNQNLTETSSEEQSGQLAISYLMRRFGLSYWHALTTCRNSGLGGVA